MLRKAVTTLGRALDNDIVLESSDVSRHHARLEFVDDDLRLVDLDSTNGTRVNGQRVTSRSAVNPGDEISFGTLSAIMPFQSAADRSRAAHGSGEQASDCSASSSLDFDWFILLLRLLLHSSCSTSSCSSRSASPLRELSRWPRTTAGARRRAPVAAGWSWSTGAESDLPPGAAFVAAAA